MPRTFTTHELYSITGVELAAMSAKDQRAYHRALLLQWQVNFTRLAHGDDDRIGSRLRAEWGE